MAWYVITYDLRKARDYGPLWSMLRNWGAVRLLESVWLADIAKTASSVRDNLQTVIDGDDGIAVLQLQSNFDWATLRVTDAGLKWLKHRSP